MGDALYDVNGEEMLVCPYDETHVIRSCRWQYHLEKCRKNFKGVVQMAVCPFNRRHEVPQAEMRYHVTCCPSRSAVEAIITHDISMASGNRGNRGNCDIPPYVPDNMVSQECWDTDDARPPLLGMGRPRSASELSDEIKALTIEVARPKPVRLPQEISRAQRCGMPDRRGADACAAPSLLMSGMGRAGNYSLPGCLTSGGAAELRPHTAAVGRGASLAAFSKSRDCPGRPQVGRGRMPQPPAPPPPRPSRHGNASGMAAEAAAPGRSDDAAKIFDSAEENGPVGATYSPVSKTSYIDALKRWNLSSNTTHKTRYGADTSQVSLTATSRASERNTSLEGEVSHQGTRPPDKRWEILTSGSDVLEMAFSPAGEGSESLPLGKGQVLRADSGEISPRAGGATLTSPARKKLILDEDTGERRQALMDFARLVVREESSRTPCCPDNGAKTTRNETVPASPPPQTPSKTDACVSEGSVFVEHPSMPPPPPAPSAASAGAVPSSSENAFPTLVPGETLGRGRLRDNSMGIGWSLLRNPNSGSLGAGQPKLTNCGRGQHPSAFRSVGSVQTERMAATFGAVNLYGAVGLGRGFHGTMSAFYDGRDNLEGGGYGSVGGDGYSSDG